MLSNTINAMRSHTFRPLSTHSCDVVLLTTGGLRQSCSGHSALLPEVWLLLVDIRVSLEEGTLGTSLTHQCLWPNRQHLQEPCPSADSLIATLFCEYLGFDPLHPQLLYT